jgi:hypothetical protein
MSADPSQSERLAKRIARLDEQIERVRAAIVKLHSRGLPSSDLQRSLVLLLETRHTYRIRLERLGNEPSA